MDDIGARIRNTRQSRGLGLKDLADQVGLSVQGLIGIEKQKVKNPGIRTVVAIADALDVSLDFLCKGTDNLTEQDRVTLNKHKPHLRSLQEALEILLRRL